MCSLYVISTVPQHPQILATPLSVPDPSSHGALMLKVITPLHENSSLATWDYVKPTNDAPYSLEVATQASGNSKLFLMIFRKIQCYVTAWFNLKLASTISSSIVAIELYTVVGHQS